MLVSLLGKMVRQRRKDLGITQSSLADLAGISHNTIYKFEKGQNNPSIKVIEKILTVLGLEITVQPKSINP